MVTRAICEGEEGHCLSLHFRSLSAKDWGLSSWCGRGVAAMISDSMDELMGLMMMLRDANSIRGE